MDLPGVVPLLPGVLPLSPGLLPLFEEFVGIYFISSIAPSFSAGTIGFYYNLSDEAFVMILRILTICCSTSYLSSSGVGLQGVYSCCWLSFS